MKPIIEVKGLYKEFKRGAQQERYLSMRDRMSTLLKTGKKKEKFWALQDINFNVHPGESFAIVGQNGAGKSTLLKILSRITPPTRGEIILRGRLASLLEVGTGFHPELTGRENIYLNGSILGLGRKEINAQFDAIVDFSGVESFLETPLKHYSSGMQLRLAFAVAAHLEPEILVIDEVLAVGDSAFQQKCINKMTEVSRSGRTILFVSHNMQAVKNLCSRGMLLVDSRTAVQAPIDELIEAYTSSSKETQAYLDLTNIDQRRGEGDLRYSSLRLNTDNIDVGQKLSMILSLSESNENKTLEDLDFGVAVVDKMGNNLLHFSNRFLNAGISTHKKGQVYELTFPVHLRSGLYDVILFLRASDRIQDWFQLENVFRVNDSNLYGFNNSKSIDAMVQIPFTFNSKNVS